MAEITRGLQRAALTLALRDGWMERERLDLAEARDLVQEVIDSYYGKVPDDLAIVYMHEYAAAEADYDE